MCMLFNVIIFEYEWGSKRYLGIWVEFLSLQVYLFIYLKVTSKQIGTYDSIIHFFYINVLPNELKSNGKLFAGDTSLLTFVKDKEESADVLNGPFS